MRENSDLKIAEKILELGDLADKRVLEVGCGSGRITALIAATAKTFIAIDPEAASIDEARAVVAGVDFRIGSGEALEFADGEFDLVIFTLSLHHQNSAKAIAEAARVLNDDGQIIVVEPSIDGELERVYAMVADEDQAKADAQRAIRHSGLSLGRSADFTATWRFDNQQDLWQTLFDDCGTPFDPAAANAMIDALGPKAQERPLLLTDRMVIQALHKNSIRPRCRKTRNAVRRTTPGRSA